MKRKIRKVQVLATSLIALSILTGCSNKELVRQAKYCYDLTEGELSEQEVANILCADLTYINCGFINADYNRTLVSKDKSIYIVPTENYLNWNKTSVKNLTDELNRIFAIINPNIKFIYQETLPGKSYNTITIDVAEKLDSTGVAYMNDYVRKGNDVYNFNCKIIINKNYWLANFFVDLDALLGHEVAHVLGLGHNTEKTKASTIMSCEGACGPNGYYTINDLYCFAILYGGYNTNSEVLKVKQQLDEYCNNYTNQKPLFNLPNKTPQFDLFIPNINSKNKDSWNNSFNYDHSQTFER